MDLICLYFAAKIPLPDMGVAKNEFGDSLMTKLIVPIDSSFQRIYK